MVILFIIQYSIIMCISPIRIRIKNSNSYNYLDFNGNSVYHRSSPYRYSMVPCGRCYECRQRKVNELIFRATQEYTDSGKRGIFLTLTYDPKSLPLHPYLSSPHDFPKMISVWDKAALQSYFKRLNEKILYSIGISRGIVRLKKGRITKEWQSFLRSEPRPISYLCVCERGSSDIYLDDRGRTRHGTSRPHYHVAVFLKTPSFSLASLRRLMIDTWTHGISYPLVIQSNMKFYRDEYGAIRYICKYMCSSNLDSYDHPSARMVDLVFSNDAERRNSLPFTLISKFFGISYLKNFDSIPSKEEVCSLSVSISSSKGSFSISLPRYYKNKLLKFTVRRPYYPPRPFSKKTMCSNPYLDCSQHFKNIISIKSPSPYASETTSFGNSCRFYSRYLLAKSSYNSCLSFFTSISSSEVADLSSFDRDLYNLFSEYVLNTSRRSFIKNFISGVMSSDSSLAFSSSCFVNELSSTIRVNKHETNKLQFKSRLSSAAKEKPELFNVQPLI